MDAEMPPDADRPDGTVVAASRLEHALLWVGFPLAGIVLAWALKVGAGWAASNTWLPLPGQARFVIELATNVAPATSILLLVGAVGGLLLAAHTWSEQTTVVVHDDRVEVTGASGDRRVERDRAAAVFLLDGELVVHGARGDEVLREPTDLDAARLEAAFRGHGYPWHESDPRGAEFRRWVPGAVGLPAGAEPLFQARQAALEEDDTDEARQLRSELARLGVVTRDEAGTRQFWRLID